ncbi:hypothetical protein HPP92_016518 [Vanilla planifolia]|uniref:DNA-binding protein BIN4 n=1 Tax=Vanilla planifolia TaxID=51239 RepID=A0A835QQF4_VANPL|nr:hypothetical protein HPP92_016518 [Vanilla planifolia]
MTISREESPDWIREFKAPDRSIVTLSLSSDTSPENTPKRSYHEYNVKHPKEVDTILIDGGEGTPVTKAKNSRTPKSKKNHSSKEDTLNTLEDEAADEDTRGKLAAPLVSSRLPIVLPEKVQRSKALVECDGDSIDLSGDVGAVGRIIVSNNSSGKHQMLLDLKGTIYRSTIVPSRTFCIVSVGQSEAKIEAIMNDFVQLEPQSNVFESETMIEGTVDGFSFDSEEEGDKMPTVFVQQADQNNENEVQASRTSKRKTAKLLGTANKKTKASGKAPKKAARKSQAAKRTKNLRNEYHFCLRTRG